MSDPLDQPDAPQAAWRINDNAAKPANFVAAEWTVLKASNRRVHARHESGLERKLPKRWFE
jgi:hypothetical protein